MSKNLIQDQLSVADKQIMSKISRFPLRSIKNAKKGETGDI